MNAYKYNSETGEFINIIMCQESPREPGKYLLPANATLTAPPEEVVGKTRIWNGNKWSYVDDNRGKTLYSTIDSRITTQMSFTLNDNVPTGYTLVAPPDSENKYTFVDGEWQSQSIDEIREQIINQLWANYKTYQRKYVDPEDLTLAVVCASNGSEKGSSVQNWVLQLWVKYYEVKKQIELAKTKEELTAIDITTQSCSPPEYTIYELNTEAATVVLKETNNHGEL